jgi:hypothetical protein
MLFGTRNGSAVLPAACLPALASCSRVITPGGATSASVPDHLTADTPRHPVAGATFIAPADWAFSVRGSATIFEPSEGGSRIALVDLQAPSADSAVPLSRCSIRKAISGSPK